MRLLSLGVLFAFVALVLVFAFQNAAEVPVVFFGVSVTASVRLLVAAGFLLGMLSGWALVGLLRRSAERVFGDDPPVRR